MEYEKVDGKVGDKDIDFGSVKDYDHGDEQESDKEYDRKTKSNMTRNMIGTRTKM